MYNRAARITKSIRVFRVWSIINELALTTEVSSRMQCGMAVILVEVVVMVTVSVLYPIFNLLFILCMPPSIFELIARGGC